MKDSFSKILIDENEIASRVEALGAQITSDYQGKEVTLVCVLKGSCMFFADLARKIKTDVYLDFISAASYGDSTATSGEVKILQDLSHGIEGKHVIIVEDIIDTGITLAYLKRILSERMPASLRVCAFLDKPSRRRAEIEADYVGFAVPDEFVVGYGLDFAQRYRNLPYIAVLKN